MHNDIPTIDSAFEEAQAELTSKEPEETQPEETPKDEEEKSETPEPEKAEENKDDSKDEEVDFLKVEGDVAKMTPDELLEVKKNWERAYTKKRQAERQRIEELEKKLAEQEAKKTEQLAQKPVEQMTPQEYATYVADMAKAEVKVAEDNAYIEAQEKSFYELDPRLSKDSPEFDSDLHDLVAMRLANERELHESQGKPVKEFDFIGRAKEMIGSYDSRIKSIKQDYLKKQSKIARTKSEDFAKTTPKTSGAKAKKKNMTLDEALEAALG